MKIEEQQRNVMYVYIFTENETPPYSMLFLKKTELWQLIINVKGIESRKLKNEFSTSGLQWQQRHSSSAIEFNSQFSFIMTWEDTAL